jgi:hypothetical protein
MYDRNGHGDNTRRIDLTEGLSSEQRNTITTDSLAKIADSRVQDQLTPPVDPLSETEPKARLEYLMEKLSQHIAQRNQQSQNDPNVQPDNTLNVGQNDTNISHQR